MNAVKRNLSGVSRYIIYALSDPRTGAVRYVGKSCYGLARPRRHGTPKNMVDRARLPVVCWVKILRDLGLDYAVEVVEELDSPDGLPEAERFWIEQFRAWGFRLLNLTAGGDGASGYRQSAEHVEKRVAAFRGRPAWNKGVRIPEERRPCHGGRAVVDHNGTIYPSVSEAARKLGFTREYVGRVLSGEYASAGGTKLAYAQRA